MSDQPVTNLSEPRLASNWAAATGSWLPAVILLLATIIVWEAVVRIFAISAFIIPAPSEIAQSLVAATRTVAGLSGLLQRGRRNADTLGTDRMRGALEFVSRGGQRGEIAVSRRTIDLALSLDGGVAELAQQRIDGGVVVAKPCAQHAAVDRTAGGARHGG